MRFIKSFCFGILITFTILIMIEFSLLFHDLYVRPLYPEIIPYTNADDMKLNEFRTVVDKYLDGKDYNKTDFNCVNFSNDVKMIADMMGIPARVVVGCRNDTNDSMCHQWLRIWSDYEPQYNKFVDYSGIYNDILPNKSD